MFTFALIAEGRTDQKVLTNILYGYFGDDIEVTELQPSEDETDLSRIESGGGWERVLKYCTLPKLRSAANRNDYVIIQIDTDVSGAFGVPESLGGKFELDEFVGRVRDRLITQIGDDYPDFQQAVLFAICVHSLECWLLPWYGRGKAGVVKKIKQCDEELSGRIRGNNKIEKKLSWVTIKKGKRSSRLIEKDKHNYNLLSLPYADLEKDELLTYAKKNPSFALFLAELDAIVQV